jgi:hypothetical protein
MGRDGGHPIGYCTTGCTHQTPEEAHEHYRQWVLDHLHEVEFGTDVQYRCAVEGCDIWTQKGLGSGGYRAEYLCGEHRNRDTYERCFYPPDSGIRESWES